MLSLMRNVLTKLPAVLPRKIVQNAMFHAFTKPTVVNSPFNICQTNLLQPITPIVIPACGFKVKGRLRRRCKDCYFVRRDQRLFVICKTHPRHKQMSMAPKEKNTWILTHATQGKVRPW